jgi:hypothetical protein
MYRFLAKAVSSIAGRAARYWLLTFGCWSVSVLRELDELDEVDELTGNRLNQGFNHG